MNVNDDSDHVIQKQYEKQKETQGAFATYVWIGSGLLLMFLDDKFSLISWQALGYFLVGTFAAALIFGWISYGIQRGLAKVMTLFVSGPSSSVAAFVGTLGLIVMILEVVAIFFAAKYVVTLIT